MASFNENNIKSKADWVNALKRTTKAPLDRSSIFGSYDDAVLYASGGGDSRGLGGSSYIGQVITVYEDDKVDVYVIDSNKTLKGVGGDASPIGYGESEHSAVLKGGNNQVISEGGVALGKDNIVRGIYAHAEGRGNATNNEYEHASGKYNKSIPKTADNTTADATHFSIGIGSNTYKRKNAFEVKQNGDIYIEGVEGRIQDKLNEISQINKTIEDNEEVVAAALNKLNENINNNCDNSRVEELQTLITNMQTYINALETRIVEIETVISQITVQKDN